MADLVPIQKTVWINLDYVVRIELLDGEAATITFADGSSVAISKAESKKLLRRFRPVKKKKKKKKIAVTPEGAVEEAASASPEPPAEEEVA